MCNVSRISQSGKFLFTLSLIGINCDLIYSFKLILLCLYGSRIIIMISECLQGNCVLLLSQIYWKSYVLSFYIVYLTIKLLNITKQYKLVITTVAPPLVGVVVSSVAETSVVEVADSSSSLSSLSPKYLNREDLWVSISSWLLLKVLIAVLAAVTIVVGKSSMLEMKSSSCKLENSIFSFSVKLWLNLFNLVFSGEHWS